MSTRAVISFMPTDSDDKPCHVYHHSCPPSDFTTYLRKSLEQTWSLPRWEHDHHAGAYCWAAVQYSKDLYENLKSRFGWADDKYHQPTHGCRLTSGPGRHHNIEWIYRVRCVDDAIQIEARCVNYTILRKQHSHRHFIGTIDQFETWAKTAD